MKHLYCLVAACLSATILTACGGSNSFSSSGPTSVAPPLAPSLGVPGLPQSLRLQPPLSRSTSHSIRKDGQIESVLHSFASTPDGANPQAGLTNIGGTLYGTTEGGGASHDGTVFASSTAGAESVLYSFVGGSDGFQPHAGLTDVGGALYGTTEFGGTGPCYNGLPGCGIVFKVTTSGAESVVYSFAGGNDGAYPVAGLTKVGGTLYGTTVEGGANNLGTVFKITTSGREIVLYSFAGGNDGSTPYAGLTNVGGTLYGTTSQGGASNFGTVFKITNSGAESVLYSFAGGSDGAYPSAALAKVGSSLLYGTTQQGGASNVGTVFKITIAGAEDVLYSFAGGSDGALRFAGLTNVAGTLYGTTKQGGASGDGTVYEITEKGAKKPTETVLYSFAGGSDGQFPFASLTNVGGTLYGTTLEGGAGIYGTVFSLSP
jgi:uncharacterized repeat protein (TIGR03803 family)